MFDPTIIFQRSHTGRNEIYEKKCGLTQSERLVLIMIDGVTSYSGVRSKLPALTDERFSRAVNTLLKKELILEVFMPVEGQEVEEVESAVVDRFLQQDPTDPLTIISFDPDESTLAFTAQHPLVGAGRIIWASDYPHPDAKFPGVVQELTEHTAALDVTERARIVGGNARTIYHLPAYPES